MKKLKNQELFSFCEHLSIIVKSGIPMIEGLQAIMEEQPEGNRELLSFLIQDMAEYGTLSHAMTASKVFPHTTISYVQLGEETGTLDEVMASLASHYETELDISAQIRSAVAYPLIMLGMMTAVIIILLVKVLPVFQQVFRQIGMEMSGLSSGLMKIGSSISRVSVFLLIVVAILISVILYVSLTNRGRRKLQQIVRNTPVIKQIPETMDYARLTQGISMGLHSGISPARCLELACELIYHPDIKEKVGKAGILLENGELFSEALIQSGLFQGMDARLISVASQAGAMDEIMEKLSIRYNERTSATISHIVSVVEPTLVIILSLLVGLVLLSVMMPLLGILSEIMS